MKKIVSVLSVAALSLSVVFAAEVSLSYKTAGTIYSEENSKDLATDSGAKQTRTALDQSGYKDAQTDIVISAQTDWAGFVLDFDPNASTKADAGKDWFDQYYAWLNYGPIQVTTGKWESRYGDELTDDKGNWERVDFNRYRLGVINGQYADDVDNLTRVYSWKEGSTYKNPEIDKDNAGQRVSTAVAFTSRPNDGTYIMLKGVAVQNPWGSTLRLDSDRKYKAYTEADGGDMYFNSGFAGEFAFHIDNAIDFNFVAKSLKRDQLALGAFLRPTLGNTKLLFGFTFGKDLSEYKDNNGDDLKTYSEMGIDFRARFKLSDTLSLTTMHNVSIFNNKENVKDQKYSENRATMWNMVSFAYKSSEQLLLQLTLENECVLFTGQQDPEDAEKTKLWGPCASGGYNISIIPGVTYSFNANASLTAGLKWNVNYIGVNDNIGTKTSLGTKVTSSFAIPVVFKVSL